MAAVKTKNLSIFSTLAFLIGILFGLFVSFFDSALTVSVNTQLDFQRLANKVIPPSGYILQLDFGDLWERILSEGVIDLEKITKIYPEASKISNTRGSLKDSGGAELRIGRDNAELLLILFWALVLSNKNDILESVLLEEKSNIVNLASTAGWPFSKGSALEHYNKHNFLSLNDSDQRLVKLVSTNIFRPCCDNPTSFPDCNHGMAMLGLLELLASYGADESTIYKSALVANSYWFPNNYVVLAKYFDERGQDWQALDPKEVLGKKYSSLSGFSTISRQVKMLPVGGISCGA